MACPSPRSWIARLAAVAVLCALGLGPALHGGHAPRTGATAIDAPSLATDAPHEPASCPVCAAHAQARTAIAPAAPVHAPRTPVTIAALEAGDDLRRPALLFTSAPPRAPPAHA